MSLALGLSQKLSQSLVMTPRLQQAIKLLQLGRLEYLEVIAKELLENPVLEEGERETEQGASFLSVAESVDYSLSKSRGSVSTDDAGNFLENNVSNKEGLIEHLLWQLRVSDLDRDSQEIAFQIIGNLDADGYLSTSMGELSELCSVELEALERVLSVIQGFDPIGVAARNLGECLEIQLKDIGHSESLELFIIEKYLKDLEYKNYERIAKTEAVSLDRVYDAVRTIQSLNPRPGRLYSSDEVIYIVPDVYVRKNGDSFVVQLNESSIPKLRVNKQYLELVEKGGEANLNGYLTERVRSAEWLIKSIEQRQQTIYKVTESIMNFQHAFLDGGVSELKPLVLRDVAKDVGLHESTVSRVTTNKYVHTPQGVFELKYFFSSGLKSELGEVSSESIKQKIQLLIDSENLQKPLSDQLLVRGLSKQGIKVARRTVAKYRESMGILSSSRRKKHF